MSHLPVKKEVVVKKEEADGSSSPAMSSSNGKSSSDQGWQDIPLKCCTKEDIKDIRYHIMKFQSKQNVGYH